MRIVHIGHFKLGTTNGLYNAIWSLACAQARSGHEVIIIRSGMLPSNEHVKIAQDNGIRLLGFVHKEWYGFWGDKTGQFKDCIEDLNPDIVHLQYIRVPKYYYYSRCLKGMGIPYVISLHGGMNSTEMGRKKWRKWLYWNIVEKFVHRNAGGIHFVTQAEKEDYNTHYSNAKKAEAVIYNAVPRVEIEAGNHIESLNEPVRFVYLGRYDPWHKGIDLMLKLMRELERKGCKTELHLYGQPGPKYKRKMEQLLRSYGELKVIDHGYIGGEQKYKEIKKYDLYIQYSRFELFGLSLAEALQCGMPCIVSEKCDLAGPLAANGAAAVVPMDAAEAAKVLMGMFSEAGALSEIAERGKKWVDENCDPMIVAKNMDKLYLSFINE